MFDSLPYRNDAAIVLRRLARSLPLRPGVLGIATCDKGLPAMMMAVAGLPALPGVIVPGGVTLPPAIGRGRGHDPDAGGPLRAGTHLARRSRRAGLPRLRVARRRLPVPRHGRHLAGGRRGAGPVAAALRARALGPAGLARHGPALGPRARRPGGREAHRARHPDPGQLPQRDGAARRLRRLDQPAAARSRDRARGRAPAPVGGGLDRGESPRAAAGQRPAERSRCPTPRCGSSSPAACRR